MTVGLADGTTVAFASSGFTGEIVGMDGPNLSRDFAESTHLGTTTWKTFIAGLVDGGDGSITVHYDPTVTLPITASAETITIDPAGTGSTISFTGFLTSVGHSFAIGEMMGVEIGFKVSGPITGI